MSNNIELETKIAFLENNVNELSDVVYQQQKMIDQLTLKQQRLSDQINALSNDDGVDIADQKPPHY